MTTFTNHKIKFIVIFILSCGTLTILLISSENLRGILSANFLELKSTLSMNSPLINSGRKPSKWKKNKLVIIPAIFKEINWADHSSWPLWLRKGLDLFNKNNSQPYDIHLYQRLDPDSKPPYNWPYCHNVHEEAGVYLKFIYDYYCDLPDKMLFIHARPEHHSLYPIDAVQCIRDDVAYTSVNDIWLQERPWGAGLRDPTDNLTLMYKCARRLLTLFGFNGEAQLSPDYSISRNHSVISAMCCAQFYVRKERIRHYTYAQWSSVYNASLQPYCTTSRDRELPGRPGIKWFGGGFELIWHIILGLEPANMPPPRAKTNTDLCHLFRPSCKGTLCGNGIIKFLTHSKPSKTNHTSVNTTLL